MQHPLHILADSHSVHCHCMIVKMRPVLVSVFIAIVMATVYQQGVQAKPISQIAFLQRILQVLTEEHEVKDEDLVRHEVGAPDLDSRDLQR